MAKGQLRSNREKKKPKAEKNKKKSARSRWHPSAYGRLGKTLPTRSSRSSVRLNPAAKSPQRRPLTLHSFTKQPCSSVFRWRRNASVIAAETALVRADRRIS